MKTRFIYPCLVMLSTLGILSSCKKDAASTSGKTTKTTTAISSSTGAIALAAVSDSGSTGKDSIYLIHCFPPHGFKDSVAFSSLPAGIVTYLTANYSGYTFVKAFKTTDSLHMANGFVVIIKYNGNFVGLKFSTGGTFENVLEQQDGANMGPGGMGWHPGGPFCDRGGAQHDTIALSAIPAAVKAYFIANYPSDTLLHANITPDSTYILISKDGKLYATNISAAGKLISRIAIPMQGPMGMPLDPAHLPSAIASYLTTTYPGYVFDQGFADGGPGSPVTGFHIFITENNTNYALIFDASGTFVSVVAVH